MLFCFFHPVFSSLNVKWSFRFISVEFYFPRMHFNNALTSFIYGAEQQTGARFRKNDSGSFICFGQTSAQSRYVHWHVYSIILESAHHQKLNLIYNFLLNVSIFNSIDERWRKRMWCAVMSRQEPIKWKISHRSYAHCISFLVAVEPSCAFIEKIEKK